MAGNNTQTRPPINRQVAINTLAAMHRRYSLPGPVQPNENASKSLDTLRQTIQSCITRDIDQVIRKYLEKFFVPAVTNIKMNLGKDSVNEDQVKAVCCAMLDATRLLYASKTPAELEATASAQSNTGPRAAGSNAEPRPVVVANTEPRVATANAQPRAGITNAQPRSSISNAQPRAGISNAQPRAGISNAQPTAGISNAQPRAGISNAQPRAGISNAQPRAGISNAQPRAGITNAQPRAGVSNAQPRAGITNAPPRAGISNAQPRAGITNAQPRAVANTESRAMPGGSGTKRANREMDVTLKRKKIKVEITDGMTSPPTTSLGLRSLAKCDPARLTPNTLFIMGSHAHKVLGLGTGKERLYTRHTSLLRYPADAADKEWIAGRNLINAVGDRTYIMILEDIEELAKTDAYKHTSLPMLGELTGFKAPPFMLRKIKEYLENLKRTDEYLQPATASASTVQTLAEPFLLDNIKIDESYNTEGFNASQYNISDNSNDFSDVPTDSDLLCGIKVEDIDDIKVDGMKDEDLDELKVDGIKVTELVAGIDVKIESIDDMDAFEDVNIKLEHDDFSLCKEDDEGQNLERLLDSDIFLNHDLENIDKEVIEEMAGANSNALTLVNDEFDLGHALSTNFPSRETQKCITIQSTSGIAHSVPVAHIVTSRHAAVQYFTSPSVHSGQRNIPISSSQVIGIPLTGIAGSFSTVVSQGSGNTIVGFGSRPSNATVIGTPQYVVTSKPFPTGNILHNAIVSRNIINRSNPALSFNISSMKPVQTAPKVQTSTADFNATNKDMVGKACNSSVMLKKVLTLGNSGTKSFVMHNTQKILATGFATGSAPTPNVTIVNSGAVLKAQTKLVNTSGTLSASHATLSALLSSGEITPVSKKN